MQPRECQEQADPAGAESTSSKFFTFSQEKQLIVKAMFQ
jgi:hypothetical protein